jgi:predicted NBD/HSP70 family sugar kinase
MIVAVDTGGTKTLVGCFTADGSLQKTIKFPTPKQIPLFIIELRKAVADVTDETEPTSITIALPGLITDEGTLVHAPNLGWRNVHIGELLTRHYDCPIYVQNDANLAGLGETKALTTLPRLSLYVTFSTGIGTGIILNGRIEPALSRSEGGHSMLEYDGALREWETFASGAAIVEVYGKMGQDITSKRTWHQIADRFSRGLLAHIPMLQPDVIIIGGGMGAHFAKFGDTMEQLLNERLPKGVTYRPTLLPAKHPDEAVLYGCYYHALDQPA